MLPNSAFSIVKPLDAQKNDKIFKNSDFSQKISSFDNSFLSKRSNPENDLQKTMVSSFMNIMKQSNPKNLQKSWNQKFQILHKNSQENINPNLPQLQATLNSLMMMEMGGSKAPQLPFKKMLLQRSQSKPLEVISSSSSESSSMKSCPESLVVCPQPLNKDVSHKPPQGANSEPIGLWSPYPDGLEVPRPSLR